MQKQLCRGFSLNSDQAKAGLLAKRQQCKQKKMMNFNQASYIDAGSVEKNEMQMQQYLQGKRSFLVPIRQVTPQNDERSQLFYKKQYTDMQEIERIDKINKQENAQIQQLPQQDNDDQSLEQTSIISNSTIYLQYDSDLNHQYDYIGLLVCIKRSQQKVSSSTAFLINQRTLVTCIHSFQDEEGYFATDQIIFIPGCISSLKQFRYQAEISQKDVKSTNNIDRFKKMKIGRELAIIFLERPIKIGTKIPPYMSYSKLTQKDIQIIGYPQPKISFNLLSENLIGEQIQRKQLVGKYDKLLPKQHIIQHLLPTCKGFSGAPIFGFSDGKKKKAFIGIHTSGSLRYGQNNSGLLFTEQMIEQINQFIKQNPYDDSQCSDQSGSQDDSSQTTINYPKNKYKNDHLY